MPTLGRAGSFFSPGVARLFGDLLESNSLEIIRIIAEGTDRHGVEQGGAVSHGFRAFVLTRDLGLPIGFASRCGIILDALQVVIDLTDNLTDVELDREQERGFEVLYRGVPRETLMAMPPLMMGCISSTLFTWFPSGEGYNTADACRRMMGVLGRMAEGQGRSEDDPQRIDQISGDQGRLFALPLWLWKDRSQVHESRMRAVEAWAFEFGRTWQLLRQVIEEPHSACWLEALSEGWERALSKWPDFPPFHEGMSFGPERLDPRRGIIEESDD